MSSRYASTPSTSYAYEPISPPWSQPDSPHPRYYDEPPRAPVMPYMPLPELTPYSAPSSHHGLITPPPTPRSGLHPCLTSTIVRYDFAQDPRTIRMSSTCRTLFPAAEPACQPSLSRLYIECEVSGQVIAIRSDASHSVTCYDVFAQLHTHFSRPLHPAEWQTVTDPRQRHNMKLACSRRATSSSGSHPSMRMIDYLEGQTVFKRLVVKRSDRSGSTFLLQTTS